MAEVVSTQPDTWGADRESYPWDDWLDGQVWAISEDVDFAVPAWQMEVNAVWAAAAGGTWVRTQVQRVQGLPVVLFLQQIDAPDGTEAELEFKPR